MSLARALRRHLRRDKEPIGRGLSDMVTHIQDVAQELFHLAILSGQAMPNRDQVEATAKLLAEEALKPAVLASLQKGKPAGEVDAYRSLLGSHVQVAFQARWAELELRRAEHVLHGCSDAMVH